MFDVADRDKDGSIDCDEFIDWIYGGSAPDEIQDKVDEVPDAQSIQVTVMDKEGIEQDTFTVLNSERVEEFKRRLKFLDQSERSKAIMIHDGKVLDGGRTLYDLGISEHTKRIKIIVVTNKKDVAALLSDHSPARSPLRKGLSDESKGEGNLHGNPREEMYGVWNSFVDDGTQQICIVLLSCNSAYYLEGTFHDDGFKKSKEWREGWGIWHLEKDGIFIDCDQTHEGKQVDYADQDSLLAEAKTSTGPSFCRSIPISEFKTVYSGPEQIDHAVEEHLREMKMAREFPSIDGQFSLPSAQAKKSHPFDHRKI
eukprot:gnl/MRDRNA2_/MRDRNA2_62426_c0_seq1.p1 gnl/MRDRNA2_/MRDRNA2_62426_c0~~gnl/MRDRNA2_/MRDRNA2_62426_c0_seq1.p1  ORF type:complete len:341 (-),score=74.30 gnl/MRDRNA2_/MRDRNA2_62426_c0_seq1:66-998(-)